MLILILIITNLLFVVSGKKKFNIINTQKIGIIKKIYLYQNIGIISLFIIVYIFIFRILRLFQQRKTINIYNIKEQLDFFFSNFIENKNIVLVLLLIILSYILLIKTKKLLIQNLKISFLKVNYYYIHKSDNYFNSYINIINWQTSFWYWVTIKVFRLHQSDYFYTKNTKILYMIYFFFKYIGIFFLIVFFLVDIYVNKGDLLYFLAYLPWYSLYQLCYNINWYFNNKLIAQNDCNASDYFYPPAKYKLETIDFGVVLRLSLYLEDITK
jgi:hypothetical protein